MATILIVEDDVDTNEAVSEYLKSCGYNTVPAYDGLQAVEQFYKSSCDAVILDIMLPKCSGLEVLQKIRESSEIPVLMLTAIGDESTQAESFDGLADDYLTKPFSMLLLGKRIGALLRRAGKTASQNMCLIGNVRVDFLGYHAENDQGPIDLTPKEIQILKLLVDNKGLVLTRTQILNDLWGQECELSERAIDTYIKRLRQKLQTDCIVTVKGVGYKFEVNHEKVKNIS